MAIAKVYVPLDPARAKPFDKYESDEITTSLVDGLVREIGKASAEQIDPPKVELTDSDVSFTWSDGKTYKINNLDLRDGCKCALCVDEYTGVKILKRENISASIKGEDAIALGNYAVSIKWSDGHTSSIYPYARLDELSGN